MFAFKNLFSSMFEKVKNDPQEKKPLYTPQLQPQIKDYTTFDQELVARTNYLLSNKN